MNTTKTQKLSPFRNTQTVTRTKSYPDLITVLPDEIIFIFLKFLKSHCLLITFPVVCKRFYKMSRVSRYCGSSNVFNYKVKNGYTSKFIDQTSKSTNGLYYRPDASNLLLDFPIIKGISFHMFATTTPTTKIQFDQINSMIVKVHEKKNFLKSSSNEIMKVVKSLLSQNYETLKGLMLSGVEFDDELIKLLYKKNLNFLHLDRCQLGKYSNFNQMTSLENLTIRTAEISDYNLRLPCNLVELNFEQINSKEQSSTKMTTINLEESKLLKRL